MLCKRLLVLLLLGGGPPLLAGEALQEIGSSADDRTAVAVTVYNDGRGLVREQRRVRLPAGTARLLFMDVAEQIQAPTVHVATVEGGAISVAEQNYEYDLLSPEKLLEKFVGQTLVLVRQKLQASSTVEEETAAKLLATNNGTVWQAGGRIVTNPPYDRIVFPNVPESLMAHPTLVWLVDTPRAGERQLEVTYLTGGLSWRADYVLALGADEREAALQGWVTIDNRSGAGYDNAQIKLVAGDVHRSSEQPLGRAVALKAVGRAASVEQEALFEYHLYSLPRPSTLKQNQTKQVQLLAAQGISVDKDYVLRGQRGYFLGPRPQIATDKIQVYLELTNAESAGLGMPIPKGIVRVYKRDRSGSPQFIGEDNVDHTPKDEKIRLELGNAFDVTAERKQVDFSRLAEKVSESGFEIRVRNHKQSPVTIRVIEPIGGDWTMLEHSHPFEKTGAFEAEFELPVPAGGQAALTYRVRVRS